MKSSVTPGSEAHFALIGARWHFNLMRGQDHADLMAFARAVWDTALSSAGNARTARNAARYEWLRAQHWDESSLFVVAGGKTGVRLDIDCPSFDRLDVAIDEAMAAETAVCDSVQVEGSGKSLLQGRFADRLRQIVNSPEFRKKLQEELRATGAVVAPNLRRPDRKPQATEDSND